MKLRHTRSTLILAMFMTLFGLWSPILGQSTLDFGQQVVSTTSIPKVIPLTFYGDNNLSHKDNRHKLLSNKWPEHLRGRYRWNLKGWTNLQCLCRV